MVKFHLFLKYYFCQFIKIAIFAMGLTFYKPIQQNNLNELKT